ncbi:hypothetical protein KM043_004331 [Ampulex compressa]|nr:hypothetical protein KM043_004331 [Ampulex compressa]
MLERKSRMYIPGMWMSQKSENTLIELGRVSLCADTRDYNTHDIEKTKEEEQEPGRRDDEDRAGYWPWTNLHRTHAVAPSTATNHRGKTVGPRQGMLERGKICSSAAIATALAGSGGNRISPNCDGAKLSLQLPNDRYGCNPDNVYAAPRTELHEIEWIDPDSVDAEVFRLVAGSSTTTTTTRNNPRRCYRTSTSSGYSSHSPPLSAGSYSCYASAVPGQGSLRNAPPLAVRDQFGGGLAVIHEGEAIPRPIWPTAFSSPRELYHGDDGNAEYDGLYAFCGCGCSYAYSYCDWDYAHPARTSAQDVLLELSRTLNSVIEGDTAKTPEEILYNISHTVAQGIGLKGGVYEYVHRNRRKSATGDKDCPSSSSKNSSQSYYGKSAQSRINPVNSKLYSNIRHFYIHNSAWSTHRGACGCGKSGSSLSKGQESTKGDVEAEKRKENATTMALVREPREPDLEVNSRSPKPIGSHVCKCARTSQEKRIQNTYADTRHGDGNAKESMGIGGGVKQNRDELSPGEPEYTMLECSDGGSSSEGMVVSSGKTDWGRNVRGFVSDLDFTLDVSRAERLGRAIAKAKRKRQWCRALTALFGLVFFVLSVVVVSLSVTRGRKVFGSM